MKSERLFCNTPSCVNTLTKLSLPPVTILSSEIMVIAVIAVLCASVFSPVSSIESYSLARLSPPKKPNHKSPSESHSTASTELEVLYCDVTILSSVLTMYTPPVCATATCSPVASGVAE